MNVLTIAVIVILMLFFHNPVPEHIVHHTVGKNAKNVGLNNLSKRLNKISDVVHHLLPKPLLSFSDFANSLSVKFESLCMF